MTPIYGGSDTSVPVFVHSRTSMDEAGEGSLTKAHKRKRTRYILPARLHYEYMSLMS